METARSHSPLVRALLSELIETNQRPESVSYFTRVPVEKFDPTLNNELSENSLIGFPLLSLIRPMPAATSKISSGPAAILVSGGSHLLPQLS